jgi:hypothetical protein
MDETSSSILMASKGLGIHLLSLEEGREQQEHSRPRFGDSEQLRRVFSNVLMLIISKLV